LSKTSIAIIGLGLIVVALPFAAAGETKADCEPGQKWTGYTSSDAVRTFYHSIFTTGTDPTVDNCEGEHWDGQDSVQPGYNPGQGAGCGPSVSGDAHSVASCANWDNSAFGSTPDPTTNGRALDFRVSVRQLSNGGEVYAYANIAVVGRAAVYTGVCNGGDGIEGATSCNGQLQDRSAVYLRDNTPGNVLATVISAAGLTKGHAAEGDCDQTLYAQGAESGDRSLCGRDNTAITVDALLP
jgi:hypothetical protein